MTKTFELKWNTHGTEAENLVSLVIEHLDLRKKHLKETDRNRRIVASILAHKTGEFNVVYGSMSKQDGDTLRDAIECLKGSVLTQHKGRATYALREAYTIPKANFITDAPAVKVGRPIAKIISRFGNVYTDGAHSEVPFKDTRLFGYTKPSLVRIVAPHHHWHMFVGKAPPPSASWQELEEAPNPHGCHDKLMDLIAEQGAARGISIARYGNDSFLTTQPDSVAQHIDTTLIRFSGKSGQRPLLNIIDTYQRTHIRWGTKA